MAPIPDGLNRGEPFDWDGLLDSVEAKRVIPVVGRELLWVPVDGKPVRLERRLAQRLADVFGIPASDLPADFGLNDVALRVERGPARKRLYAKVYGLVKDFLKRTPLEIPHPLRQLASITDFTLFVSTTFDPYLKLAIDAVRFGGQDRTQSLAFSMHDQVRDVPEDFRLGHPEPLVYQILGDLSLISGDYALTDEDKLEFLHALQTEQRPARLFDCLRENHLLFLGCGFSDWLARFFIRIVSDEPLRDRAAMEIVADGETRENARLRTFLEDVNTFIFPSGDVTEFVDTLSARWRERHPHPEPGERGTPTPSPSSMEEGALFISYASEDRRAAERMKTALEAAGVQVWYDEKDLKAGEAWEQRLRENISRCAVFIPLLSAHAQRLEGVFRKEWRWALARREVFPAEYPFIQPVLVDDLKAGAERIDAQFWSLHCERFLGGAPDADFVRRAKDLVRLFRSERRA